MAQIVAESGIPIPASKRGRRPGGSMYPLETMGVGDSFETPKYIQGSTNVIQKRTGRRFMSRRMENGNIRVWRIK
jgi:hypothetical protein